jgi:hypothetical protein
VNHVIRNLQFSDLDVGQQFVEPGSRQVWVKKTDWSASLYANDAGPYTPPTLLETRQFSDHEEVELPPE